MFCNKNLKEKIYKKEYLHHDEVLKRNGKGKKKDNENRSRCILPQKKCLPKTNYHERYLLCVYKRADPFQLLLN